MKRLNARVALLLVLGFCCQLAHSADSSAVQKLIERRYVAMDHAAAHLNLKRYTEFAAPDLIALDEGQTFTGTDEFSKHLSEDFDATKKMYTFASKIDQFVLAGDVAKVDVTTHMVCDSADPDGKYGAKGAVHRFDLEMKFRNEWKQRSGQWMLTRFDTVGFSGTMDGKPIPQPGQE